MWQVPTRGRYQQAGRPRGEGQWGPRYLSAPGKELWDRAGGGWREHSWGWESVGAVVQRLCHRQRVRGVEGETGGAEGSFGDSERSRAWGGHAGNGTVVGRDKAKWWIQGRETWGVVQVGLERRNVYVKKLKWILSFQKALANTANEPFTSCLAKTKKRAR